MASVKPSFFEEVKSFTSTHKVLCALTLGLAIVGYSIGNLSGRTVSWIQECMKTTKKTDTVARDRLLPETKPLPDQQANKNNVQFYPTEPETTPAERATTQDHSDEISDLGSRRASKIPTAGISSEEPAEATNSKPMTREMLSMVRGVCEKYYTFKGSFGLPKSNKQPASEDVFHSIARDQMTLTKNTKVKGIGNVQNCYTWNQSPSLEANVPECIQNAAVRLPKEITLSDFEQMRKVAQEGVVSQKGIVAKTAQELALKLAGIVIEATLPYRTESLLNEGADVSVHCIFQTGLNFAGVGGGGVPLSNEKEGAKEIEKYYQLNAQAALHSALTNKSDVLIFNIGIGTGYFGGNYKPQVKQANVDAICSALEQAKTEGKSIEVIVPDISYTQEQIKKLEDAGILIVKADKDAVTALVGRQGATVSQTIAADPMSILGIHGPGLWWETVGSASDEERAAFLSPCYALGYIPIHVYEQGKMPKKIAALSEYMMMHQ